MSSDKKNRESKQEVPWLSTTQWSVILAAGGSQSSLSREALTLLCQKYWYPLYVFARRRGHDEESARDVTQSFFARLLEKKSIKIANKDRGRFRSFLLVSFKNFLSNEWDRERAGKRGGGKTQVSLDLRDAEGRYLREPVDPRTPEEAFDRRWALEQLDRVLGFLGEEMRETGAEKKFGLLTEFLIGESSSKTYAEVANDLDMTEGAVKVAVHRMRRRFGLLLRAEIARTVSSDEEIEAEIRYLISALGP
jgi:RNA polymerase sigma-70 factor (ECF subfamily)